MAPWGMAFKPDTEHMRQAPSRVVIQHILERGGQMLANDPVAMNEARRLYPSESRVEFANTPVDIVWRAVTPYSSLASGRFRIPVR